MNGLHVDQCRMEEGRVSLWPVGLLGQIWGSVVEAAVPTPVPSLQEGSLGTDWSWLVPGSDPVKVMTLSALAGLL